LPFNNSYSLNILIQSRITHPKLANRSLLSSCLWLVLVRKQWMLITKEIYSWDKNNLYLIIINRFRLSLLSPLEMRRKCNSKLLTKIFMRLLNHSQKPLLSKETKFTIAYSFHKSNKIIKIPNLRIRFPPPLIIILPFMNPLV